MACETTKDSGPGSGAKPQRLYLHCLAKVSKAHRNTVLKKLWGVGATLSAALVKREPLSRTGVGNVNPSLEAAELLHHNTA
eukprot:11216174-Lingulodinium_polyedra.AAC.1